MASACWLSSMARRSGCSRATGCRRHSLAVAEAIASLPVDDVILDGEVTWDGHGAYHVFDILWLDGRDVTPLPLEERRALLSDCRFERRSSACELLEDPKPWERACARGLGRRDREAARLAVRAPPLAALAEDEVRGDRRSSSSAASPIRRAHASGLGALLVGYFDRRRFRLRREGRHWLRHEAAARPARAAG